MKVLKFLCILAILAIASVIYNRLSNKMPLGIDQTAVYIAKVENRWDGIINKSDLESNSPYNTTL